MTPNAQLATALAGRYTIDREIGRGGMATVYLAPDVRHNRAVALKVLNPELGAVLGVERFLAEIEVTVNCSTRTCCRCSTRGLHGSGFLNRHAGSGIDR